MILVCCTFLAGVLYYLVSKEERAYGFAAFLIGTFLGVVSSIIMTWISFEGLAGSASVVKETLRIYLQYFFVPVVVSIPLFVLFAFSLSEETFANVPAMLLGVFTVIFVVALFTHRNEPEFFQLEILLLLIFTAVFLAELLIKIFLSFAFFPEFGAFVVAVAVVLVLCFPLSLVLGFYHFTNTRFITFIIAVILLALTMVPTRIVSIFK